MEYTVDVRSLMNVSVVGDDAEFNGHQSEVRLTAGFLVRASLLLCNRPASHPQPHTTRRKRKIMLTSSPFDRQERNEVEAWLFTRDCGFCLLDGRESGTCLDSPLLHPSVSMVQLVPDVPE